MTDALRRHRRFLMGLFIAAAAFLYLAHIGSYHLIDLDEGRYHRVAMEMVLSGGPTSITCPISRSLFSNTGSRPCPWSSLASVNSRAASCRP